MNRFLINYSPELIAQDLCDKHVVKMPLEEAQMLSTVLRQANPEYANEHGLYRVAHAKHPCTIWAGKTRANYIYACDLWQYMCIEYTHRYGKHHASERFAHAFIRGVRHIPDGDITPHPECFGEHAHLKTDNEWPVDSYRQFYQTKQHRFKMVWTKRDVPDWFVKENVYA